jgi:hypothetical protein
VWALLARLRSAPASVASVAPPPEVVEANLSSSAPAVAPTGRVVVSASPWGEVLKVTASDGAVIETPGGASTPLVLTLPPGDYEVQVARPGVNGPSGSCLVHIQVASLERCQLELAGVNSADYFRESGWWR